MGYTNFACQLLHDAIKDAEDVTSDDLILVPPAMLSLEFLGSLTAETYFDVAGWNQQFALEKIGYRGLCARALERFNDPDVRPVLFDKMEQVVRPMVIRPKRMRRDYYSATVRVAALARQDVLEENLKAAEAAEEWPYQLGRGHLVIEHHDEDLFQIARNQMEGLAS